MLVKDRISSLIDKSNFISRDLSWLRFNERVLDQARKPHRNIFEGLKFLSITSSNLDEFCMIRIGSLYNYLDYSKERIDYSGLRATPFKTKLFADTQDFVKEQGNVYKNLLSPQFRNNGFSIKGILELNSNELSKSLEYFKKTIFPMLTPMVYDSYHSFPILMNKILIFGVVTKVYNEYKEIKKLSFVQIPQNLPRFYEFHRENEIVFVPIEDIIRWQIDKLFRNIEIVSVNLFRITRNADFSVEESDDIEADFIDELKRKLKTRRTGRVVRIEVEPDFSPWMMEILMQRWELEQDNFFKIDTLIDYTGLLQIVNHKEFRNKIPPQPAPVPPLSYPKHGNEDLFEYLKKKDIFLHHPYNSMEPMVQLLEKAAEDPKVLSIKLTIYRIAKESRITSALLKAAENGKHVSVLFEVKARFDEENNIKEALKLQKAGCFVIYGVGSLKTHTKLLMIVRKEGEKVTRYCHMSSGNYNEETARMYTDFGLLTTGEIYAHDISEFFNVITGHSEPHIYQNLITAPHFMRKQLIDMIRNEAENAQKGLPSGIIIKVNSLEDNETINEFYKASQAGVPIKLIVRGICCLKPGRKGLSENITVKSIVGNFLEHARMYYFHNAGDAKIYGGSADIMVRSFERRIESLFAIVDPFLRQQVINILYSNWKDNVNSYFMQENGTYVLKTLTDGEAPFNIHEEFFKVTPEIIQRAKLFD